MNTVLTFLDSNRERLELARYGINGGMTAVILTPRFHASSHIVVLVFARGNRNPVLVAKIPRCAGSSPSIERETANLRAVQSLRPGGFHSIPQVVAFEEYCAHFLLLETALTGQPMSPALVRRELDRCCSTVTTWLIDLYQLKGDRSDRVSRLWYEQSVEQPLHYFHSFFPLSSAEKAVLAKTESILAPLQSVNLPQVFEHGDLAHPNIMRLEDGTLGVLDWELATPCGMPSSDLFFFLTFAAFALGNAHQNDEYLRAFHKAFFERQAWARRYVWDYVQQLGLATEVLTPLFLLCWVRYVVNLLKRLDGPVQRQVMHDDETAHWLRANRYFALWQYAVEHVNELNWDQLPLGAKVGAWASVSKK